MNDSTEVSVIRGKITSEESVATDVEDRVPSRDNNIPVLKGAPRTTALAGTHLAVPSKGSHDFFLRISGFGDDGDEISLMYWNVQHDVNVSPSFQYVSSAPKQTSATCQEGPQKDVSGNKGTWRSLAHPNDPLLLLIPCEIPHQASVLQQ